jgi:hypothetical protein
MDKIISQHVLGNVILLGDRTSSERILQSLIDQEPRETGGRENLCTDILEINSGYWQVCQQIFCSRSAEESVLTEDGDLEEYHDWMVKPEVILLTYNAADTASLRHLDAWIRKSAFAASMTTEIILVGILPDSPNGNSLHIDQITNAMIYVEEVISHTLPEWRGTCSHLELNPAIGIHTAVLRNLVSRSIFRSKGIWYIENSTATIEIQQNTFASL